LQAEAFASEFEIGVGARKGYADEFARLLDFAEAVAVGKGVGGLLLGKDR